MNEIIFNGKRNSDLGLILSYFKPQPPAPKIIKSAAPYMNGSYDFSNLYGETAYEERKIACKLQFVTRNRKELYTKYSQVLEWLLNNKKAMLEYTCEPGLYYMAKVENPPTWEVFVVSGSFDFDFIAYPFKIGLNLEGSNQPWDTFNFETDIMQDSSFDIASTKSITLYNTSAISITPSVVCSSTFSVIKSGITYNFSPGTTKDFRFTLDKGLNNLTINGTGNIEFNFRKEVF